MEKYQVVKENGEYTIGVYDDGYKAFIVNDGICQHYYWDTEEEAQAAADAANDDDNAMYLGWLGDHGNGKDELVLAKGTEVGDEWYEDDEGNQVDADMYCIYSLFGAVKVLVDDDGNTKKFDEDEE